MSLTKNRFHFFGMVIFFFLFFTKFKNDAGKSECIYDADQNDMKKTVCNLKCQETTLNFELENM